MSLKCSIFGHAYGNAEVLRDREEDGSEVVITIREVETCARCEDERVVSENKEVTTLETPSDIVGDDLEDGEEDQEDASTESPPEATDDGAAESPADEGEVAQAPPGATAGADEGGRTDPTIPDAEGGTATQTAREDPPADPAEDDAVILEDDDEDEESEEREPGEWPEEPPEDDDEWEPSTEVETGSDPIVDDGPDIEGTGVAVTAPEGSYHCPDCGFSVEVEDSSLREGDFCPECHRGALEVHTN